MIVSKNDYMDIQKSIMEYASDVVSQDELNDFIQHIKSKLEDFKPTLMIYGTYNAGKSTLLNALFGQEEMAKTGDAPETNEVHGYEYNGYTIFDTPGMNAHSEDDATTLEHLEKSEIVLFVMSNNGSLEEKYVYNKISEVIRDGKPIIIVLNNKTGIDPDSIEAKKMMIKVGENLRKIGDKNHIDKIETKVDICMVNAASALKGKVENKRILLKKSNIVQLEKMIEDIMEQSDSKEVINALNIKIQNFIEMVIAKIDRGIDNEEAKQIEELITFLEKYKKSSEVKLKNIVSRKIRIITETLSSMLLSENVQESDILAYVDDMIGEVNLEAEKIFKQIEKDLSMKVDDFSKKFAKLESEKIKVENLKHEDESEESMIPDEIKEKMGEALKDKRVLEEGAKFVLFKAKELLPKEVMYGKGPVWISKAAGKVAIGLNVALEAYSVYSAYKEHQQMIEEKRSKVVGAKNNAESIAYNIQNTLNASIEDVIAETFDGLIAGYRDASYKLSKDKSSLMKKKEGLVGVLNKIQF